VTGVTAHPDSAWVTQQARNMCNLETRSPLLHGFSSTTEIRNSPVHLMRCSVRRHEDHPHALSGPESERRRGTLGLTVRSECLDWILIRSRRHLERVLRDYVEHYGRARPHRAVDLKVPESRGDPP
jgi:putative transposase